MRTTLDLPEDLIKEVQKYAGVTTKKEAVLIALEDYKKRFKLKKLASKLGTFDHFINQNELKKLRK